MLSETMRLSFSLYCQPKFFRVEAIQLFLIQFTIRQTCNTYQTLLPKINSHCGYKFRMKFLIGVLIQKAGLANARVTQSQKLQQIIVINVAGHVLVVDSCQANNKQCHKLAAIMKLSIRLLKGNTKRRKQELNKVSIFLFN